MPKCQAYPEIDDSFVCPKCDWRSFDRTKRPCLTEMELMVLRYAERNHGRNFVTSIKGEPHNETITSLTERGLFTDGGPSQSGRWRNLTPLGRAALAAAKRA